MSRHYSIKILGLIVTVCFAGGLYAKDELPAVTEDGLHLIPDSKMAVVYAEPGAELSGYSEILLLDAYVAFKKNWDRKQRTQSINNRRISSKDIEEIKTRLATEFDSIFKETLIEGGYPVVDDAGETVLLVRPAIINLDINSPDTQSPSSTRTYVSSAGEMTLYLELYDSVTGDLIAKAMDRKADRASSGYYTWSNSSTNKAAAVRIMTGWADILLQALNEARQKGENEDEDQAEDD